MSITNQYTPMQFTAGTTWKQDTRNRPSKLAMSPIRDWRFEQSEGIRPAEYMGVYKNLPVAFQDVNTEDWCVIPKGRIVSSLTAYDLATYSGLAHPASGGMITIANQGDYMGTGTGAKINVSIDNSHFGYDEGIVGLLTPANGGADYTWYYSADDIIAGTRAAGGLRAVASGRFTNTANIPIGVAFTDIYQDIRGEYLNYRMHPDGYHFLTDWYIEVPFINYVEALAASGCNPVVASAGLFTNHTTWRNINKWFTYLAFDGATAPKAGQLITSDGIGNYAFQTAPSFLDASGDAVTTGYSVYNTPKTCQTVGKLVALDTRMPKWGLDDVLTYPRSGMPGSQTAGMIKNLFDFAYYCMSIGTGTAPTVEAIYNAIRSGAFGLARIQLLVS